MARQGLVLADGRQVRRCRDGVGFTQEKVAEDSGVGLRTIQMIERGGHLTELDTLKFLADVFNVDVDSLICQAEGMDNRLSAYRISFDSIIKDKRRSDYVGRDFVFAAFDQFLNESTSRSGYFLVLGDPGIGKSALIARAITLYKCQVFHFNNALEGINTPRQFLGSICAQLVDCFALPYADLPEGFDQSSAVLGKLLELASSKLEPNQQLIIPVDALDEVLGNGTAWLANPLYLPIALPPKVYFLLTSRRQQDLILQGGNVRMFPIKSLGKDNLADVQHFVEAKAGQPGIRQWRQEWNPPLDVSGFVKLMVTKSDGNFMYLRHVLSAIEGDRLACRSDKDLPEGLQGYYRWHWHQMKLRAGAVLDQVYRPVICSLAAATAPVSIQQLTERTELSRSEVGTALANWMEFLHESHADTDDKNLSQIDVSRVRVRENRSTKQPLETDSKRYGLYHRAFQEFLANEIDVGLEESKGKLARAVLNKLGRTKRGRRRQSRRSP